MEKLKEKISEAFDKTFIGNAVFDEEEVAEIINKASELLRILEFDKKYSFSNSEKEIIFIAVVNIVKKWNTDENQFWDYIIRNLVGFEQSSSKIYSFLVRLIEDVCLERNAFFFKSAKKKYYATLLAHSFAPLKSTFSFFELCWQVYCEDLSFNFDINDDICEIIAEELKKRFENDDLKDSDLELCSKVYSIRVGIKQLALEASNLLSTLIRNTMKLIHKTFNSEPIIDNDYLSILAREWWSNKEKELGNIKKKNTVKVITNYENIKCKYIMQNNEPFLYIPSIRLKENFLEGPIIKIFNLDNLIYNDVMTLKGSSLIMTTKPLLLELEQLICSSEICLRIIIEHSNKQIYDSKLSMIRSFILFKDEREIFSNVCLPGNYELVSFNFDDFLIYPNNIKKISSNRYIFNAVNGENLQNSKKMVMFISDNKSHDVRLITNYKRDCIYRNNDEEYIVLDGDLLLAVKENVLPLEYGVKCENSIFNLVDFSYEISENIKCYNISSLLLSGEAKKIVIFKFTDNKIICNINVVKFENLQIQYDKEFYYDEQNQGEVVVELNDNRKKINFFIEDEEVFVPFENGELVITPPIIKWRINESEWNNKKSKNGIWYKNIANTSEVEIIIPPHLMYTVKIFDDIKLEPSNSGCIGKYKLGEYVYAYKDKEDEISCYIQLGDETSLPLFKVHTKSKFIDNPVLIVAKRYLLWKPSVSYIGDKDDKFRVTINNKDNEIISIDCETKDSQFDISNIEDNYYLLKVESQASGFLCLKKVFFEKQICIGQEENLKFRNKEMYIEKVMLDGKTTPYSIKPFYIDNIKFIIERDGNLFYSGKIFVINANGQKKYLDRMPDDNGNYNVINPVRIELRSSDTCWIVGGLKKDMDDFLGELFLNQQNKVSNETKNIRTIDYYIYKIKEK